MKATEFDVGPLSWVKSEIDLALKRADQALQEFSGGLPGGGDPTQLKFCRTHLHQVQGALTIVGLDGVTQLAEAAEALLERIEQGEQAPDEATLTLARRALSAIGHYLDELLNGEPNQPLRLLSVYRDVQTARGLNRVAASDLFFPDLSARPPRRTAGAARLLDTLFVYQNYRNAFAASESEIAPLLGSAEAVGDGVAIRDPIDMTAVLPDCVVGVAVSECGGDMLRAEQHRPVLRGHRGDRVAPELEGLYIGFGHLNLLSIDIAAAAIGGIFLWLESEPCGNGWRTTGWD